MKLIIWLWNPWTKYDNTRHNVWFMFLDFLIKELNLEWKWEDNKKSDSIIYKSILDNEEILLIKPQTFMNLSWESVLKLMSFYKIKKENIIIVYDDISMDFWKVRFRDKWSAGWQNWVKDIISKIWEEFKRIKIWIWQDRRFDLSAWVLSKFSSIELNKLDTNIFTEAKKILINNIK